MTSSETIPGLYLGICSGVVRSPWPLGQVNCPLSWFRPDDEDFEGYNVPVFSDMNWNYKGTRQMLMPSTNTMS